MAGMNTSLATKQQAITPPTAHYTGHLHQPRVGQRFLLSSYASRGSRPAIARVPSTLLFNSSKHNRLGRVRSSSRDSTPQIDNVELLIGDCIALVVFCLYKQISAIVLSPDFAGWLAPLHYNPVRFVEFAAFAGTLCASWVVAATLTKVCMTGHTEMHNKGHEH